jgi:hypothetical protein
MEGSRKAEEGVDRTVASPRQLGDCAPPLFSPTSQHPQHRADNPPAARRAGFRFPLMELKRGGVCELEGCGEQE